MYIFHLVIGILCLCIRVDAYCGRFDGCPPVCDLEAPAKQLDAFLKEQTMWRVAWLEKGSVEGMSDDAILGAASGTGREYEWMMPRMALMRLLRDRFVASWLSDPCVLPNGGTDPEPILKPLRAAMARYPRLQPMLTVDEGCHVVQTAVLLMTPAAYQPHGFTVPCPHQGYPTLWRANVTLTWPDVLY